MNNKGVDFSILQKFNVGGATGIRFDAQLTFTTYNNEITELSEGIEYYDTRGSRIITWIRNQKGMKCHLSLVIK